MDKYLKMADVFKVGVSDAGIKVRQNHIVECVDDSFKPMEYAAHAINSHDELVAEVERLRDMVVRMQTYLDMAGEYPEKESGNPVRRWLFDAIDCAKQ